MKRFDVYFAVVAITSIASILGYQYNNTHKNTMIPASTKINISNKNNSNPKHERVTSYGAGLTEGFFNNRGLIYDDKEQYDLAIQDFDKAIELKPDYAEAFHNRGLTYYDKGQYERAIQDYDKAIQLKPDFALPFNARGNAYVDKGQYDLAIQDYDKAIQLRPDALPFNGRGNAYAAKGQYDQAIQDYDKAIRLKPDFAAAINNRNIAIKRR